VDGFSSSREMTPVPRPRRRAAVDRGAVGASSHTVAARESRRPGGESCGVSGSPVIAVAKARSTNS
jgi:hypothetical protein